eukprot:1190980-Prorocentrum_minimum.AAC.1
MISSPGGGKRDARPSGVDATGLDMDTDITSLLSHTPSLGRAPHVCYMLYSLGFDFDGPRARIVLCVVLLILLLAAGRPLLFLRTICVDTGHAIATYSSLKRAAHSRLGFRRGSGGDLSIKSRRP